MFETVLFPIDNSRQASETAAVALKLAQSHGSRLVILSVDPEKIRSSGIAQNVFPKKKLVFKVTTADEFNRTVEQFFGAAFDEGRMSVVGPSVLV